MDLTQGSIKQHVHSIAIPASIGLFFNTMFNVVDSFFAGKISIAALAALSLTFPIFFIIIACSQGVLSGCAALITNALGTKNVYLTRIYTAQCVSYGIFFSFILTAIGIIFSPLLIKWLGAEGDYFVISLEYIHIIFFSSFCFILNATTNAILLSHGNSKTMRNVLIISFFINSILDPWFLYGGLGIPSMGLKGIAIATVFAMIFSTIYLTIRVIYEGHFKNVRLKDFSPSMSIFYAITHQSLPSIINMLSIGVGFFVITYYVNQFGSDFVAAYGVSMRIQQIFLLPTIGINVAALMIIGQNNGAGFFSRIDDTIKECLKYGCYLMTIGGAFMFFTPQLFLSIFVEDAEVIEIGVEYLKIASLSNWAYMILATYTSVLQGLKRPNFLFILGFIRQIIFPILIFHIVLNIFHLGIISLWFSLLAITWSAAIFTAFFSKSVLEKEKKRRID